MLVVEIVRAVLQEDSQRSDRALANQSRIQIASRHHRVSVLRRSIANRYVAADDADHLAKHIGPVPGNGEGTNRSAAGAADRALPGIVGQAVTAGDARQHLLDHEPRITIVQGIVFSRAMIWILHAKRIWIGLGEMARRDEDADGDWNVATMYQVVEYHRHAQ